MIAHAKSTGMYYSQCMQKEKNSFYVRTGAHWRDRMPLIIRLALPTCNKFIDLTCKTSAVQVGTMSITSTR